MAIDFNHPSFLRLKKAIRENPGNFVGVVGSGLSRPSNIPSWLELKDHLVECANNRVSDNPLSERDAYLSRIKRISNEKDYWRSFEELKQILGKTQYEVEIREKIAIKDCLIPNNYKNLWRLNVSGIFTLNIDEISSDSYAAIFRKTPDHATSIQPSKYSYFLTGGNILGDVVS
jgi:hypothetical protein